MSKKIHPQYGETDGCQQELPLTGNAADGDSEGLLTPAGDAAAIGSREVWAGWGSCRQPGHNRDSRACVDEVTALREAVRDEEKAIGANRRYQAPVA
jgi:hypothetical protein